MELGRCVRRTLRMTLFMSITCFSMSILATEKVARMQKIDSVSNGFDIGDIGDTFLRDRNVFDIVLAFHRDQLAVFNQIVEMIATKTERSEDGREGKWLKALLDNALYAPLDNTTRRCAVCRAIVTIGWFKMSERQSYQNFSEAVISVCEFVTDLLNIRGDPLCRGAIELHLPHINETLHKNLSLPIDVQKALRACQFLNSCPVDGSSTDQLRFQRPSLSDTKSSPARIEKKKLKAEKSSSSTSRSQRSAPPPNSIKVVQLTDIHVEKNYAVGSETFCGLPVCCDIRYGTGSAKFLGDFRCNIPRLTMEIFLQRVAKMEPDVIIFGGDIAPHTIWEESSESQRECSETLVEAINASLSDYKVYPIIGNHEMYPTNLFSMCSDNILETADFLQHFARLWQPVANFSDEELKTVHAGGYYTKRVHGNLRIVSFNSNYMYTLNWYNMHNHKNCTRLVDRPVLPELVTTQGEYAAMKEFVEDALRNASENNEKVILFGHHPPGGADYLVEGSRWYRELVLQYKDTIVLQPAGHTHTDEFRLIYDDKGTPSSIVYVSPSMTTKDTRNPSMRIYYLDNTNYSLLDYEQYFMDLRPAKTRDYPPVDWTDLITFLYSAKEEYGLEDLSPGSWHELLDKFKENQELLQTHRRHEQADARTPLSLLRCNDACVQTKICRLSNINYDQYDACLAAIPESTVPTLPTTSVPPGNNSATGITSPGIVRSIANAVVLLLWALVLQVTSI